MSKSDKVRFCTLLYVLISIQQENFGVNKSGDRELLQHKRAEWSTTPKHFPKPCGQLYRRDVAVKAEKCEQAESY